MKKIVITIIVLGIITLGGGVVTTSITGTRGSRASAILSSLTGQKLHKAELVIEGMWCASCATGAEYSLKTIEGVADAYVNFTNDLEGKGWVVYENGKVSEEQIIKAIEPYKATIVSDTLYTK